MSFVVTAGYILGGFVLFCMLAIVVGAIDAYFKAKNDGKKRTILDRAIKEGDQNSLQTHISQQTDSFAKTVQNMLNLRIGSAVRRRIPSGDEEPIVSPHDMPMSGSFSSMKGARSGSDGGSVTSPPTQVQQSAKAVPPIDQDSDDDGGGGGIGVGAPPSSPSVEPATALMNNNGNTGVEFDETLNIGDSLESFPGWKRPPTEDHIDRVPSTKSQQQQQQQSPDLHNGVAMDSNVVNGGGGGQMNAATTTTLNGTIVATGSSTELHKSVKERVRILREQQKTFRGFSDFVPPHTGNSTTPPTNTRHVQQHDDYPTNNNINNDDKANSDGRRQKRKEKRKKKKKKKKGRKRTTEAENGNDDDGDSQSVNLLEKLRAQHLETWTQHVHDSEHDGLPCFELLVKVIESYGGIQRGTVQDLIDDQLDLGHIESYEADVLRRMLAKKHEAIEHGIESNGVHPLQIPVRLVDCGEPVARSDECELSGDETEDYGRGADSVPPSSMDTRSPNAATSIAMKYTMNNDTLTDFWCARNVEDTLSDRTWPPLPWHHPLSAPSAHDDNGVVDFKQALEEECATRANDRQQILNELVAERNIDDRVASMVQHHLNKVQHLVASRMGIVVDSGSSNVDVNDEADTVKCNVAPTRTALIVGDSSSSCGGDDNTISGVDCDDDDDDGGRGNSGSDEDENARGVRTPTFDRASSPQTKESIEIRAAAMSADFDMSVGGQAILNRLNSSEPVNRRELHTFLEEFADAEDSYALQTEIDEVVNEEHDGDVLSALPPLVSVVTNKA